MLRSDSERWQTEEDVWPEQSCDTASTLIGLDVMLSLQISAQGPKKGKLVTCRE